MFTVIKLRSQICVGISTATVNTKQGKQNAAIWLMKPNFSQNITFIFIMLIFSRAKLYNKQVSSIVAGYITVYLQKIEVEKIKIKVLICTILEHLTPAVSFKHFTNPLIADFSFTSLLRKWSANFPESHLFISL